VQSENDKKKKKPVLMGVTGNGGERAGLREFVAGKVQGRGGGGFFPRVDFARGGEKDIESNTTPERRKKILAQKKVSLGGCER